METYNVYASGNFEMIVGAYNGLAMMVGDSNTMFVVAMILSLLMLMISALMKTFDDNQKPVYNFFFGLIMFLAFMSKVTVVVESRVTGQAQSVDNVPLLVAVSGSIATGLFTDMTDDLRTAFSVVTPVSVDGTAMTTGYGGLDPLRALMKLNQEDYASSQICMMSGSVDLCATLEQYAKNCVGRDIITGGSGQEIKASALMNAAPEDTFLALKSTNTYWETPIIQKAGPDTTKTCAAAYTYISGLLSSSTFKNAVDVYNQQINLTDDEIGDATKIFTGTGISAYDMALQRLVWTATKKGLTDARDKVGLQVEQMMFTAKDQRLIKMASSYEMFNELAPAIITFFELFAIFIAPLMLIMLVTGRMGFMGIGSYIMFVLFTNMWPLIAVGVESYLNFALASNMSSSSSFGPAAMSWNGTPGVVEKAQTYLAVGSMMMTAIPALSMAVLFKGVQSMSGVAKQSTPDAPVNTHYVAPNIASAPDNGASKQGQQENVWNPNAIGGSTMSGASNYGSVVDTSQAVRQEVSHGMTGARQQMEQSQAQLTKSVGHLMEIGQQASHNRQFSSSEAAKLQEGYAATMEVANMIAKREGITTQQALEKMVSKANTTSSQAGGSFDLSLGFGKKGSDKEKSFGGGFSIGAGLTQTGTDSKTRSEKEGISKTEGYDSSKQQSVKGSNNTSALFDKAQQYLTGNTLQGSSSYKDAAQQTAQSAKSFSDSKSVVEQQSALLASASNGNLSSSINIGQVGQDAGASGKGFNAQHIIDELVQGNPSARSVLEERKIIGSDGQLTAESQKEIVGLMDVAKQNSGGQNLSETKLGSIASLGFLMDKGLHMLGGEGANDRQVAGQLFHNLDQVSHQAAFQQLSTAAQQSVAGQRQEASDFGGTENVRNNIVQVSSQVTGGQAGIDGRVGGDISATDASINKDGVYKAADENRAVTREYNRESAQALNPAHLLFRNHNTHAASDLNDLSQTNAVPDANRGKVEMNNEFRSTNPQQQQTMKGMRFEDHPETKPETPIEFDANFKD